MEQYQYKIVETIVVIFAFLITTLIIERIISKVGERFKYQSGRVKVTKRIIRISFQIIAVIFFMVIWGVKQTDLLLFLSSILTILGVAFFAQWSIISNITSTLIIFFNHPIKIGDHLTILDKDFPVEGRLSDVGIFFIILKTKENKKITIPSNVFMQKMIRKEVADAPKKSKSGPPN